MDLRLLLLGNGVMARMVLRVNLDCLAPLDIELIVSTRYLSPSHGVVVRHVWQDPRT